MISNNYKIMKRRITKEGQSLSHLGERWCHGNPGEKDEVLGLSVEGKITLDEVIDLLIRYQFKVERRGTWVRVDNQLLTGCQARGLLRWAKFHNDG